MTLFIQFKSDLKSKEAKSLNGLDSENEQLLNCAWIGLLWGTQGKQSPPKKNALAEMTFRRTTKGEGG